MKQGTPNKVLKNNQYQFDDDNIRYKINKQYYNTKSPTKTMKKENVLNDDEIIRYKLPSSLMKTKPEKKSKSKPKLKVNFWSNKQTSRLHNTEVKKQLNRRHTVAVTPNDSLSTKSKSSAVKVRKRVSFLPSPLFSDNHVPMVTVPDDLTIHLNEEEANDLREDLNQAFVNSIGDATSNNSNESLKRKRRSSLTISPKSNKRKRSPDNADPRSQGSENELEFFSKYVVQKLRKMETNQRIYSENLINTVLMLGQLGKLNGKSKISEA